MINKNIDQFLYEFILFRAELNYNLKTKLTIKFGKLHIGNSTVIDTNVSVSFISLLQKTVYLISMPNQNRPFSLYQKFQTPR